MEITQQALEQRLAFLKEHQNRLDAELKATFGAIRDCEYWLEAQAHEPEDAEDADS